MIRDPSDGSIREKPIPESEPVPDPLYEQIRSALLSGKVRPERVSDKWEYQRAWNDGIDFCLRQVKMVWERRE